jgi:hypothetical protein
MNPFKENITQFFHYLTFIGSIAVITFWMIGSPILYTDSGPVMSIFTSISLFMLSGIRLAHRYLLRWPVTLSMAILVIVGGGNISSIMMMTAAPQVMARSSSPIVMTSVLTSIGIILFCSYELLIYLRNTPKNTFIIDDILIHLALVPGGLSLLGHLFKNPAYLSMGIDPRVGISLLEMGFMASFAASTLLSNQNLFLWQFLKGGISNILIFIALFVNQYIAPIIYVLLQEDITLASKTPGVELFIMLAGVFSTLGFLMIQSHNLNKGSQNT